MLTVITYILSNIYGIEGSGLIYFGTFILDLAILSLIEKLIDKK